MNRAPGASAVRVLYSFPHKIGASRICHTAWQQVSGLAAAGANVHLLTGAVQRALPPPVRVDTTLARGKLRIPYRLLGTIRACALHDFMVARALPKLAGQVDVVHTWPLAATRTLRVARALGIPTFLERPNAHTRFAYDVVQRECERLGVSLPPDHEHAYKPDVLRIEEEEYRLADRLLCPSDFVVRTFLDYGFPAAKVIRHTYGYDEARFHPPDTPRNGAGLTALFAGVAAVRKGLHYALEAWLRSPAHQNGTFLIAGDFLPAYRRKLAPLLDHPSVKILGHRSDIPDLMRQSHILVLPTLEEGFPLVCAEALGSGCVPLVSDVCSGICRHMENALVHRVGDVDALVGHLTLLHRDRGLLRALCQGAHETANDLTWTAAGVRLLRVYQDTVAGHPKAGFPSPRAS